MKYTDGDTIVDAMQMGLPEGCVVKGLGPLISEIPEVQWYESAWDDGRIGFGLNWREHGGFEVRNQGAETQFLTCGKWLVNRGASLDVLADEDFCQRYRAFSGS